MRVFISFVTVLVFSSLGLAQVGREWKQYAPKEAGFEVKFPGDPAVKQTRQGSDTIHLAGIQRQAIDGLGYVCQWLTKEKPFESKVAEAAYLRGQQVGSVGSSKGKLVEEKEISLGGFQGREFLVEVFDGNLLRCRVYVTGNRVINLQVWGKDKEAVRSKDAERFLESLKIAK